MAMINSYGLTNKVLISFNKYSFKFYNTIKTTFFWLQKKSYEKSSI